MAKSQSYLQYGTNPITISSYTNWAQGIGNGISAVGWTKQTDTGAVTWANILTTVVTFTITTVGNASNGLTVYTTNATIATPNQYQGAIFVLTGLGANNGTFTCFSNTSGANATLTLGNARGTSAAGQNGTATNTISGFPFNENSGIGTTGSLTFSGAWTAGTSYTGVQGQSAGYSPANPSSFNVVTSGGVTYQCGVNTFVNINKVQPNTNQSFNPSATGVTGTNTGSTVWNLTGAGVTSNQFGGYLFTVSGYTTTNGTGSSDATANNGVFICLNNTATSAGTFNITLQTITTQLGGGTNITTVSSTATTPTISSSTANTTYYQNTIPQFGLNSWFGLSVVCTGFAQGGNNGTFTAIAGGNQNISNAGGLGNSAIVLNNPTGVNDNGGTIAVGGTTGPLVDTYHWLPYNYEVWKANGALAATSPIYLKLVYTVQPSANAFAPTVTYNVAAAYAGPASLSGNSTGDQYMGSTSGVGVGNFYECDFQGDGDNLSMILFRTARSVNNTIPDVFFIDRARDQNGNALASYFSVGVTTTSSTATLFWTLFAQGLGGVIGPFNAIPTVSTNTTSAVQAQLSYAGMTPVFPVFAVPGYVANPMLQAICMKTNDFKDGELINAVVYGTSHTFLMSQSNAVDSGNGNNTFLGIRWE